MEGGNVIFFIFLAIMMVLLIRWSIRVFFTNPKPVTSVSEPPRRRARSASEVFPSIFLLLKLLVWCRLKYCKRPGSDNNMQSDVRRTTIYTINADSRPNDSANNFTDLFWDITPNTSRSREEVAKEDKDLPSYEEVIRMDMREQVLASSTSTNTTIVPVTPLTSVTSATPVTSATTVTPINIISAPVTASTV